MLVMAYTKLLSASDILMTAIRMLEEDGTEGISLRAVAAALGVKAPSLYRYFPQKEALELAVADEVMRAMTAELQSTAALKDPESRFRGTAEAYLRFARERFELYRFIMDRVDETHGSDVAKGLWSLLLDAASVVSGQTDDTDAAVATWSFLHGYAVLEHSGGFGASGPKGALERGLTAFLTNLRLSPPSQSKQSAGSATTTTKGPKRSSTSRSR
jgi:AcrR family transcriptional regulator